MYRPLLLPLLRALSSEIVKVSGEAASQYLSRKGGANEPGTSVFLQGLVIENPLAIIMIGSVLLWPLLHPLQTESA
jgi:hypothetical protein